MATLINNKNRIVSAFNDIKMALQDKDIIVTDVVTNYAEKISLIDNTKNATKIDMYISSTTGSWWGADNGTLSSFTTSPSYSIRGTPSINNVTNYFSSNSNDKTIICSQDCTILGMFVVGNFNSGLNNENNYAIGTLVHERGATSNTILNLDCTYSSKDRSVGFALNLKANDIIYTTIGYQKNGTTTMSGSIRSLLRFVVIISAEDE